MGKDNLNGAYNRAPIFRGENYVYKKDYMFVHLMSLDKMLQVAIIRNHFVLIRIVDGIETIKPRKNWDKVKSKKCSYDLKVRNIIISSLNANVYYSISIVKYTCMRD